MSNSIGNLKKPIRPKKADFDNDEAYQEAMAKYKLEKQMYDEELDKTIQNALNDKQVFQTKDEVLEWAKKNGITIDDEVLESVDLRSLNEVKPTLEEMFEKYPSVKSYSFEYYDGEIYESSFNIGLTDDGLLSANGGFNFNQRLFQDYEHGLSEGLDSIAEGYFVRGDGSFSTLVRHEYGHNVQGYIENSIAKKYHHNVDNWQNNFKSLDEKKAAEKAYLKERKEYDDELISLAKLDGVSEYAQTNTSELFAEGFAEYASGGNSEFGIAFGQFLERWYK